MTLEPRERFSPMIPLAFFCVAALAHLCVVGGVLWRKKGSSRAAARNPPGCAWKNCQVGAFCVVSDKCSQIAFLSHASQTEDRNDDTVTIAFRHPFSNFRIPCRSQNRKVKARYLWWMLHSWREGKGKKERTSLCGIPLKSFLAFLEVLRFSHCVILNEKRSSKIVSSHFQPAGCSAQLDSTSQQRRRWPWIKDTLLFADIRANVPRLLRWNDLDVLRLFLRPSLFVWSPYILAP